MTADYISLLAIVAAAVICPIIAQIVPKKIIPEAVLLLIAGAVFGPNMVGTIGLCFKKCVQIDPVAPVHP